MCVVPCASPQWGGIQYVDHLFELLTAFVEQFQVRGVGTVGRRAGGIQNQFALVGDWAASIVRIRILAVRFANARPGQFDHHFVDPGEVGLL